MTTPPVPQWAVDAAKECAESTTSALYCHIDYSKDDEHVQTLARIIAAHAPQGQAGDGERLDWLENKPVMLCAEGDGKWSCGGSTNFTTYALKAPSIRAAIDAARQKDL